MEEQEKIIMKNEEVKQTKKNNQMNLEVKKEAHKSRILYSAKEMKLIKEVQSNKKSFIKINALSEWKRRKKKYE